MRSLAAIPVAALVLALAPGCLRPFHDDEACPDARRDSRGQCCPVWSTPDGAACVRRPWVLPELDAGLGEAGVRWVRVGVDGAGVPAASWIEGEITMSRVVVAEAAGAEGGFTLHHPGAALTGEAVQVDVALGPDGAALATWKQQYPGGEGRVFVAEREPDGTWRDPASDEQAFSFLPTAYEPQARFFPNGERLVVWNQWMSTGYGVAVARKPPSGDWQLPADADDVLSQHTLFSNAPHPVVNERGDAVISWYQSLGGSLLAWQSERFGYDGTFSKPSVEDYLSVPDTPVDSHPFANPKPALSAAGDAAVVWTQENGKGSTLVYLATRTPEGVWTKPASVEDALSPRLGYARCPQIAFTPSGDLFVVWYQDTGNGHRVLAAHRTPAGDWIEPGREPTLLSSPGVQGIFPSLAVGREGSVLVAWSEQHGDAWVIAARRRSQSGTSWGPVEILSVPNGDTAAQPAAAIGGPGDFAIVGWSQGNGKGDRAYFATVPVD